MKKLFPLFMIFTLAVFGGCGSDGDDDGGTNGGTTLPRVVAAAEASAPNMATPDAGVWATVDSVDVTVAQGILPTTMSITGTAAIPATIRVKAIKAVDSLFLQLTWADPTNDIWPGYYYVSATSPTLQFDSSVINNEEDQMLVMFANSGAGWYDVWNWSVVSTGSVNIGRGYRLMEGQMVRDTNTAFPQLQVVVRNPRYFGSDEPTNAHQDTSVFAGHILLSSEMLDRDDWIFRSPTDSVHWNETSGWALDQRVPGMYVNEVALGYTGAPQDSRYDIRTVAEYDDAGSAYTLVMARALDTGFDDDMDLSVPDSVKVSLAVFDGLSDFTAGSARRGVSQSFYIILK